MAAQPSSKIFIIGGTGAQGLPIVRSLIEDGKYSVRVLTRDPTSARSRSLQTLSECVELFEGSFTNESDLRRGYAGCDATFVNIDGFNTGEKAELFWAIRCYELAIEDGGIRFFLYGNLPYAYKLSGYKKEFRTGHYDGKGRVGEWILWQARGAAKASPNAMGAALFTTGPYMEMVIASGTPMTPTIEENQDGEEAVTWKVPLGHDGAVPHVALDDCGYYVRWLFDHPKQANGMDLSVSIDYIHYDDLVNAFTKVTGKPARFIDVSMNEYFEHGPLSRHAQNATGYSSSLDDPATLSIKENFTGAWNVWRHARTITPIDFALLDQIHPNRIRSAEQWFKLDEEKGHRDGKGSLWDRVQPENLKAVLKLHEDGFRSPAANR
jgi:hypothetical protein